ncbi:MAG: diadenylate cyclase CdaA [Pyrinomonadaceae bacterium]|nr:diadenylate cyclase CdaA [Pyrinomonadaceae bacterium]MCX7639517.1 diadenylate cyclase CdaA [Pyrinomonadaceae bacterium]MDW8304432.1 diadenylate cyclase CdaA [Acidobacteriota bacterium]
MIAVESNTILRSLLDIFLVFIIFYGLLKLLQKTRSLPVLIGILAFGLLYWIATTQELITLEFVLRSALPYIGIAIIVLFQSEIRQALVYFGKRLKIPEIRKQKRNIGETIYDEIVLAIMTLSTSRIGALLVFERNVSLENLAETGVALESRISYDLLVTIFNPSTPLHDGAVIIRNERIAAASVFLPLTKNPEISRELGTRHRAAIGITEDTDAVAVVVSEETGIISFAENGQIRRNLEATQLRELILQAVGLLSKEQKQRAIKITNDQTSISIE